MARIVKKPDERRSELIACAQNLFYSKGYENTSISDIVNEIGVAKGTFYYYFDSKLAILEAMVDTLITEALAILYNIVNDETLTAIPKWVNAFQVVGNWKTERKDDVLAILHMMWRDENILLMHKLHEQTIRQVAPEFAKIIAQGVEEGVFDTEFVEEAAEVALGIMVMLSDVFADVLLNPGKHDNPIDLVHRKLIAMETAVERIIGAPQGSLPIMDPQTIAVWFTDETTES